MAYQHHRKSGLCPDGQRIASCGHDETIRIWDTIRGNVQTIAAQNPVYAVAWSSDRHTWPVATLMAVFRCGNSLEHRAATCVQTLRGHTYWVFGLAFAPNGDQLASAVGMGPSDSGTSNVDACLQTLVGHTDQVQSVAWSPDGRTVASGGFDHTIRFWDGTAGRYRVVLQGHNAPCVSIAFTPDSRSLLSGSDDGTLRLWDVESGHCVRILQGYAGALYDVDWSPDGKQLASVGTDMLVTLWEVDGRDAAQGVAWPSLDRDWGWMEFGWPGPGECWVG